MLLRGHLKKKVHYVCPGSLLLEDDRIGDKPKQCFLVMPIAGLLYSDVGTLV